MLAKLFKYLLDNIKVSFIWVFSINQGIVNIYYDKNIEFFYWDLVNITLEACQ